MNRSNHLAVARDGESEQPEWREKEDTESLTSDDEGWTPLPSELHPSHALEVEKLFRRRAHHHHPASSSSSNNETYNKSQPTPREGDETEQKPATETHPIHPPSGGKHCDRSFENIYQELPVIDHPPLILPSNWLEDSQPPTVVHSGGDELLMVDDSKSDDMADFTVTFRRSGSTQRHASVSYHSSTPSERIYRQPRCRRLPPRRGTEEIYGSSSSSKTRVAHISTRHKWEHDRVHKSSRRKHQRREEPSSSSVPPVNGVFQNALLPPPPPSPPPPLPLRSILEVDDGCSMDWMEDDLYPEASQVEQSGP